MEEKAKKDPVDTGKGGFKNKAKKLAEKADDFLDEKMEKVEKSKAYESVSEVLDKAEEFIGDKVDDIHKSSTKEKLETFADKTEDKAKKTFSKLKDLGRKLADKTADKLEDIADNIKERTGEGNKAQDS